METLLSIYTFSDSRMLHIPDLFSSWHPTHIVHPQLSGIPDRQTSWPAPAPHLSVSLAISHGVFLLPSFFCFFRIYLESHSLAVVIHFVRQILKATRRSMSSANQRLFNGLPLSFTPVSLPSFLGSRMAISSIRLNRSGNILQYLEIGSLY